MSTTDLAERPPAPSATLFNGATPAGLIEAATEAANALQGVIRQQKLSTRIRASEHVNIEGWQIAGTFAGVFGVKDSGVVQLPWPELAPLPEEPPLPGPEPRKAAAEYPAWEQADITRRAWERHRDLIGAKNRGLAYGFSASWRAQKDGRDVGWGEGRCTRGESTWATRDDYALASMAQTRGQSRALAAPLRFIIKLAGYATTPAEEADGAGGAAVASSASPFGDMADPELERKVAQAVQAMHPDVDGFQFVEFVCRQFGTEHLPAASARMALAIQWAITSDKVHGNEGTAA